MSEYKKQTDEIHEVKLDSKITNANWGQKIVTVGEKVNLFVQTHFVGSGSEIEIKVRDKKGTKVEKLKGLVFDDQFSGSIVIPENAKEEICFTAKLPKHGLEMKSKFIMVFPKININNLKWGQKEARRGDTVKLSADVENLIDGAEVLIIVYEYDADGAHDFITKFSCRVKNKKIQAEWAFEYHEDTDEIPTQEEKQRYGKDYSPPEYFFVIDFNGRIFGENRESGLLKFKDWLEIKVFDCGDTTFKNAKYVLHLPDGKTLEGSLNDEGYAKIEDIQPGRCKLDFPEINDPGIID